MTIKITRHQQIINQVSNIDALIDFLKNDISKDWNFCKSDCNEENERLHEDDCIRKWLLEKIEIKK